MRSLFYCLIAVVTIGLAACGEPPVPKPEGYPRIDFPPKAYRLLDTTIPYRFEMASYAHLRYREQWHGQDIYVPAHKATIHLTYYHAPRSLDTLIEDARALAYKHAIRADAIDEQWYENADSRVYALLYTISGDVASAVQFYATDSVGNFLRGALYFYCPPNADSLAPAVDFYREDIVHLIETLEWKE